MTLTYETAKKLKDAGFPFRAKDIDTALAPGHPQDCSCLPTLSELIEACGEDFFALMNSSDGWVAQASRNRGTSRKFVGSVLSSNPEEAVAALWLSLNSK